MSRTAARDRTSPAIMTACIMRKAKKTTTFGAIRQPNVARMNNPIAHNMTGLRPNRSEIGPMKICRMAFMPRYSATDNCISR